MQKQKENQNKNFRKFKQKPSSKLTKIKTNSLFTSNKNQSFFERYYKQNSLPCVIQHGSISNKLVWKQNIDLATLDLNPLLLNFYIGLTETQYPYNFICKEAIKAIAMTENVKAKIVPLLKMIVQNLRNCLISKNNEIFQNGLWGLKYLSIAVDMELNKYLKYLISGLSKAMNKKDLKESVIIVLGILEQNGGSEAYKEIKKKIPTYISINQNKILIKIQLINQQQ